MARRMAMKVLTSSDLTFFRWHHANMPAGNQKAVNLNRDVFIDALYPSLPEVARSTEGRIPLDLTIYGPGLRGPLNLQRKIIKHGGYKNWRLDGEWIDNPEEEPERFNSLRPSDLLILDFRGDLSPYAARAVFLAAADKYDASVHKELLQVAGDRPMVEISTRQLEHAIERARPSPEHPVHELALEAALEDAAHGGASGMERLLRRRSGKKLSKSELRLAREEAERVGEKGEELVNAHLQEARSAGRIQRYHWASSENAVCPYDFHLEDSHGASVKIEVKSTCGDFAREIHFSLAELVEMADETARYDIYRVYDIEGSTANLRVAQGLSLFGKGILRVLDMLPPGVRPDSVSVQPSSLSFGPVTELSIPQEDQ